MIEHDVTWLTVVISVDNLSDRASRQRLHHRLYVEPHQHQLLGYSSTRHYRQSCCCCRRWLAGFGVVVDAVGYCAFFVGTALDRRPVPY